VPRFERFEAEFAATGKMERASCHVSGSDTQRASRTVGGECEAEILAGWSQNAIRQVRAMCFRWILRQKIRAKLILVPGAFVP
jgi:hypothetical protein